MHHAPGIDSLRFLPWPLSSLAGYISRRARRAAQAELENQLEWCGGDIVFDDVLTVMFLGASRMRIGRFAGFNRYVFINAMGGVTIGDDTRIGPFTIIHSGDHEFGDPAMPVWRQGHRTEHVHIGADVWIGAHATILRGSRIPNHCVIGAGSVVDRRLELQEYDIVRGNPARVVGSRRKKALNSA